MKTVVNVLLCVCLVFPLSSIAQKSSPNESGGQVKFSSNYTTTCNTQLLVKFTDESVSPPNDYTTNWTWIFGDGRTSNDWNPDYRYTAPGVYTVKLIIKTNAGIIDSFTRVDYIQVGRPIIKLGKDTSICEGSTIVLDAGHQNTGASYSWNTGDTTQQLATSEPGKYSVTVKWNGCEAKDTIIVNSRPGIFPNFGFNIDATCLPTKAKFSDSSFICPGNSIIQYKWEFGDGTTSTQQNPQHIYTSADSFNVRLTIWDNNGFSMTRSKRVIVNAAQGPIVNLGNDTTVCEVMPFVLDAGNPDATFTWSTGDIYQSCVITSSGPVWVRVEQNGCVATDTVNIVLTPTLTPQFGIKVYQVNCPVNVVFTDSSKTCGVNIVQWDWDFGDGNFSHEQHPSHEYTENGEFVVRLTIHDDIGNSVTRSKRVIVQSSTVLVNLGKDTTVCFGNSTTLDAGIANATYLWSTGETTKEIFVYDAGEYWVRVQKGSCFGYDTIRVASIFPINPAFDFTVASKCLPVEVKFEDKSIAGCGQQIVQWKWTFGDGATSTQKNP
ncbi:MAG: PKD domain-containing protein, partial [Chitinophagaceae bacterium]|nr:PKD domain-containing protein [Chitinophagaceae bacterium]